jgi:hypothetical protein
MQLSTKASQTKTPASRPGSSWWARRGSNPPGVLFMPPHGGEPSNNQPNKEPGLSTGIFLVGAEGLEPPNLTDVNRAL